MASKVEAVYAEFQQKVKRTVFIDTLSPLVTESVLKTALGQFGTVKSVQFISNYIGPENLPFSALVEMTDAKEAKAVVSELSQLPFMMSGMPRPVRARLAEPEMFDDRPPKPGRRIEFRWLEKDDPDFETASKLKSLVQKHAVESDFLLEEQLAREEKLAKQQSETLKANYKKFEVIQGAFVDHSVRDLARQYRLKVVNDH